MALIREITCTVCEKTKFQNVRGFNGVCIECLEKAASKKKRVHLAGLKGLTVEERLEKIEEQLYDTPFENANKFEPKQHKYA